MNQLQRENAIHKIKGYVGVKTTQETFNVAKKELLKHLNDEINRIDSIDYETYLTYHKKYERL